MNPTPVNPTESSATGTSGQAPAPTNQFAANAKMPTPSGTCVGQTSSGSLKLGTADQPQPYALAIAELEAKIDAVNLNGIINLQMGHFPQAQHDAERSLQLRKVLDLVKGMTSKPKSPRELLDKTNDTLDRIRQNLNAPTWTEEQRDEAFEKAMKMIQDMKHQAKTKLKAVADMLSSTQTAANEHDQRLLDCARRDVVRAFEELRKDPSSMANQMDLDIQAGRLKKLLGLDVVPVAQTNIETHPNGIYYIDLAEQLATVWWRCSAIGATLQHLSPLKDARVFTVVCEKHGGRCFHADTPMAAWRAAEKWLMSPDREYAGHLPEPLTQGIDIHPGNPSDLEPKSYLTTIGNQPNSVDNSTPAS